MLVGIIFLLVQYAAAVPWLFAITRLSVQGQSPERPSGRPPSGFDTLVQRLGGRGRGEVAVVLLGGLLGTLLLGVAFGLFLDQGSNRETLVSLGRYYAAFLQLQLYADLVVLVFALIAWLWPKGGAVARAAFREGYRQPLFWMLFGLGVLLLGIAPLPPYFTFGEDYIMVQELGFDIVILAASVFGVLAAQSVTEEIEGRTAITVMSKPVSRRQFLLGKFLGIFLCALVIVLALGWLFDLMLLFKHWFDHMDPVVLAPSLAEWIDAQPLSAAGKYFCGGIALWGQHTSEVVPGLVMAAMLVMVLTAVAVTLAVRTPMIVNLTTCIFIYMIANLMPIVVLLTRATDPSQASAVQGLLHFTARLFDSLLPNLELFRVRPTLLDENTLPLGDYFQHVAAVSVYGVMFTAIVLLLGLVLFEDRDLA